MVQADKKTNVEIRGDFMVAKGIVKNYLRGKVRHTSGATGLSAYELAVVHGFKGTEAEWLASIGSIEGFAEDWNFEFEDGTVVTKAVYVVK